MKRILIFVLVLAASVAAQTAPDTPTKAVLPDYSGMYSFLEEGEFVQLTVEDNGAVTGLVSRYRDADVENKTFVEHFFKEGKMDGKTLSFSTKIAQDISYDFKGIVERGEGKTPADEAYYVLKGTLTENRIGSDKRTTSQSQQVEFRSFPRDGNGSATD